MLYFKQMERNLVIENLYFIPLIISAFVSVRVFAGDWPSAIKLVAVYLLFTTFIELFASAWSNWLYETNFWSFNRSNHWIYNIGFIIRYPFLFLYFGSFLPGKRTGQILVIASIILMLLNYFLFEGILALNSYTVLLTFSITLFLCFWFYRYIFLKKEIVNLLKATEFWIASGLLFYHAATLPLFFVLTKLNSESKLLSSAYYYLNDPLNIIMYTLLTIAFLCRPKFLQ